LAINVDLVADASRSIKEAGKFGDALEKVADELDDVAKGSKSIDDKVQDAFRGMAKEAKDSGKKIGDSVKEGTDKAGEGLATMKEESASSAKEAAASFSSLEDSADVLQEVLANAFTGLGPAGMAAGIVAAAGIGLVIGQLQGNAEKINENKEKMLDFAKTFRGEGGEFSESMFIDAMDDYGDSIADTKEWWEVWQKDAVTGWEEIRKQATDAGVSYKDAFSGSFGSLEDAERIQGELAKRIKETTEAGTRQSGMKDEFGDAYTYVTDEAIKQVDGLQKLKDKTDENIEKQRQAKEIEEIRRQGIAGTTQAYKENVDAINAQTDALKGSLTTELDYLDGVDALTQKLIDNGNTTMLNTAAGRDNVRAIIDQANVIEDLATNSLNAGASTADVTAKFNAQKDALINQVTPAFGGSREAARLYIEQILKSPQAVNTDVNLDGIPDAEQKLSSFTNTPRNTYVGVHPATNGGGTGLDNYLAGMANTTLYVTVKPKPGSSIDV
jgi:hypothetical protein